MLRNGTWLGALAVAFLTFIVAAQAAGSSWAATALCDGMSVGHAINDSGAVAGAMGSARSDQAVVCDSGGDLTVLPVPEGTTASRAQGINDDGDVVGQIQVDGAQEAVVWYADGSITRLGFLSDGGRFSSARDINNEGEVVGLANLGTEYRAFRWAGSGPIEALPLPDGQTGSLAAAINDDPSHRT
jgi:probable HAF family extracellular repeat protein